MASFWRWEQSFSVYVGNIPIGTRKRELDQLFSSCGKVLDVFIPGSQYVVGSMFGFVRFGDTGEAHRAIKDFDGYSCRGYALLVGGAKPPKSLDGGRLYQGCKKQSGYDRKHTRYSIKGHKDLPHHQTPQICFDNVICCIIDRSVSPVLSLTQGDPFVPFEAEFNWFYKATVVPTDGGCFKTGMDTIVNGSCCESVLHEEEALNPLPLVIASPISEKEVYNTTFLVRDNSWASEPLSLPAGQENFTNSEPYLQYLDGPDGESKEVDDCLEETTLVSQVEESPHTHLCKKNCC